MRTLLFILLALLPLSLFLGWEAVFAKGGWMKATTVVADAAAPTTQPDGTHREPRFLAPRQVAEGVAVRFVALDLVIDSGDQPLAVYQVEARAAARGVRIVGIEGGEHPLFAEPPYYDPKAMLSDRVILAAFSTADSTQLPHGRIRIARLHVQLEADVEPDFDTTLTVAATVNGRSIDAKLSIEGTGL